MPTIQRCQDGENGGKGIIPENDVEHTSAGAGDENDSLRSHDDVNSFDYFPLLTAF
jgi:hypothetical protein